MLKKEKLRRMAVHAFRMNGGCRYEPVLICFKCKVIIYCFKNEKLKYLDRECVTSLIFFFFWEFPKIVEHSTLTRLTQRRIS